jgi:hypothetical protein
MLFVGGVMHAHTGRRREMDINFLFGGGPTVRPQLREFIRSSEKLNSLMKDANFENDLSFLRWVACAGA